MKNKLLSLLLSLFVISAYALAPKNMVQRSHLRFPGNSLSNICGYVDSLGNEYALVGTSVGMTIVDVTNPDSVFSVASFVGPNSIWREIKTWQQYAYVTTEGGGGLQIIDLRNLPGTNLPFKSWTPTVSGQVLSTIHALHIDDGFVYLYGSNIGNGGIVMGDLIDPWNPTFAGLYDAAYVHDGYVRNDTVWAGEIYAGTVTVIDVSSKTNPVILATQLTPSAFTHNTWLSDNSKYLFTTDEVNNSYLGAYDVSNVNNIVFMDKIQSQYPGGNAIIHNTHIRNDYAITSWYKDGVVITDCHRPQNLVNVGYIDDCPLSGGAYGGVWGVFPFFPSGTIVTSDIDSGLYVYTPTYVRACYLEGIVHDSLCGTLLNNVKIQIIGTSAIDSTDFTGNYKTGTPDSGSFMAMFSKAGYTTRIIPVNLVNGQVTALDINLFNSNEVAYSGTIVDAASNVIPNAIVQFNGVNNYSYLTDTAGSFSNCTFQGGQYGVLIGKWGYLSACFDTVISHINNTISVSLTKGVYDDFSFEYGWTTSSTSSAGRWTKAVPSGTFVGPLAANPGNDVNDDCSTRAYVTGNNGAGASTFDNVNNGQTTLISPTFDLTTYVQPFLNYATWFFDGGPSNPNDSMLVSISNGTTTVLLETITANSPMSGWMNKSINLSGLIPFTSTMSVRVKIADVGTAHIVEGGFDHFQISEGPLNAANILEEASASPFIISPNPSIHSFTLSFTNELFKQEGTLLVCDIAGRIVERLIVNGKQISFGENLQSGVYFVNLISNGKSFSQKAIKY